MTARYGHARTRAGAVRQQQPTVKLTHLVVVVTVALLTAAAGRAIAVVVRGGRRLLEYQRAVAIRVAVGTAVLQVVRQQRMPAGVALVRM